MAVLVRERFEGGWLNDWSGKSWNAYGTASRSEGEQGLRILFRKGSHYGVDLRQQVLPTRRVRMSYQLRFASNWVSNSTGKLPGFADLRYTNTNGKVVGHGNRKPAPDGFSMRTWFGKTVNGFVPVGLYVYHAGQRAPWGDSITVGEVRVGMPHVVFEVVADLDAGTIRGRLGTGDWVSHPIRVGADTAVTTAWLNGYWGGWRKAPVNMAADVDDYLLEDLSDPALRGPAVFDRVAVSDQLRDLADTVEVMEAALESIGVNVLAPA